MIFSAERALQRHSAQRARFMEWSRPLIYVRDFEAICIVGGKNKKATGYTAPCGVCRQVMMEFCNPKTFKIILAIDRENYRIFTLEDMLPQGFGPANLE
jgi:cytidine deaminase